MQMLALKAGFAGRRFIVSLLLLHAITFLVHIAELFISANSPQDITIMLVLSAFLNDTLFVASAGLVIFPVYLLIYFGSDFTARMFMALILILIITLQVALMQYYLVAKVPLGSDLWSYSWSDIRFTVKASAPVSWWQLLLFPLFILVTLRIHYTFQQHTFSLATSSVIAVLYALFPLAFSLLTPIYPDQAGKIQGMNKTGYFIDKSIAFYNASDDQGPAELSEYPLMHRQEMNNGLGLYLDKDSVPPNIVMLIVEGLGKTFTGPGAEYGGCMPFLDSLSTKSLYWNNFLSTTGRTFGVLPSMLGSLPFGPTGFMDMGNSMPYHTSLARILKQNGYSTGFYYGGDVRFDKQDTFLFRQNIDVILDASGFTPGFTKIPPNEEGFSWGYPDGELYRRSFEMLPDTSPYLSVYLTVTTHEPFMFPGSDTYNARFNAFLSVTKNKAEASANRDAFKTLMYADDAIRYFIETYKQRPDYKNTIFIITGDHRMIPVRHKNPIDRYHVPLLVFSPLLKNPALFRSVAAHNDIPSTFAAYLAVQYGLHFPDSVHWLGGGLTFDTRFSSKKRMAIMRNKGDISEYLDNDLFLTDGDLYVLDDNMEVRGENDPGKKETVSARLATFKTINAYVCSRDKLYRPGTDQLVAPSPSFSQVPEEIKSSPEKPLSEKEKPAGINPSSADVQDMLNRAWDLAVNGHLNQARIIAKTALEIAPADKQVYYTLIDIELEAKNKQGALTWYNKAAEQFGPGVFEPRLQRINAL